MKESTIKNIGKTIAHGFGEALRTFGFFLPKKYPVELWVWETMEDEEVCDDCLERSDWGPMDIADWMKKGLPRTPEAETQCAANCRCQLVRYPVK